MLYDSWQIATAIPLLLCSIAALSLIVERILFLMRQKDVPQQVYEKALSEIAEMSPENAIDQLTEVTPFYHQALILMKEEQDADKSMRDDQVSTLMFMYSSRLRRRMSGLVTIAALAPMLGLLGTIVGLMRAFRSIGEHAGPVEPSLVANGLWQALTTTAAGLVIAVLCILAHALLVSKVKRMLARSQFLLNTLSQTMYQKHRAAKA